MQDEQEIKVPLSSLPFNKGKKFFSSFDQLSKEYQDRFKASLEVTGSVANNPLHRRPSLKGEAFDLRNKNLSAEQQDWIDKRASELGLKVLTAFKKGDLGGTATAPHKHIQESDEIRVPLEKLEKLTNNLGNNILAKSSLGLPAQTSAPIGEFNISRLNATQEIYPEEIKKGQDKKRHLISPKSPYLVAPTEVDNLTRLSIKPIKQAGGGGDAQDYIAELIEKGVGWIPGFIKQGENFGPWLMSNTGLNPNANPSILLKETAPGVLLDFQLSPLQKAEELRKKKGLSVVESWLDPEILGHSGLALIPGIGPMTSQFSTEVKEGDYRGASQTAILIAIPSLLGKLKEARLEGKIKDIKIEPSKSNPVTTFDDSTKTIYINPLKIGEAIKEGRNPAALVDEGISHEIGHAMVDSPSPQEKLLLKESADKMLKERKEKDKFIKEVEKPRPVNRESKGMYKAEEKVVEDTTTGEELKKLVNEGGEEEIKIPLDKLRPGRVIAEGPISLDVQESRRLLGKDKPSDRISTLTSNEQPYELTTDKGVKRVLATSKEEAIQKAESKGLKVDSITLADNLEGGKILINPESGKITPQLANIMSGGLTKFIQQDITGGISKTYRMAKEAVSFLSPKTRANKQGLDLLMMMKGERELSQAQLSLRMQEVKKAFDKVPNSENIEFMDRLKTGQKQTTPELQDIADFYRKLDDDLYSDIQRWKPSFTYLDNHFRILWKEIPGVPKTTGLSTLKNLFLSKRPLQGSKGFLKQHTLDTVTEGIQKGGVPVSYNPQTLMELSYIDSMKYITAQRMWSGLKDIGLRKFVKMGDKIPDGFRSISDPIASDYFPSSSGQDSGRWVVEDSTARLLENHLSRDYIRESELGRGLVGLKNLQTMVELGFSGFHATFEGVESIGSQIGLGLREFANIGILKGEPKFLARGLAKGVTSPIAPFTTSRLGGSVIRYIKSPQDFIKTTRGASFIKSFPGAATLIDDLFMGGGQIKMNEGYRTQWYQAMKDSWKEGNYPGAALRALPAGSERLMLPLFDKFIPRLKMGTFLQEYSTALVENEKALNLGKLTRPELARKTWDFVEDRFGEMNFDNLFWDNTFKTATQVMFRSITWKLGNLRASLGAVPQQGIEVGKSLLNKKVPKLSPKMAWLGGMSITTVAMASIISKSTTGKYPWEWAKEDPKTNIVKEVVFPRISATDPSKRISTPTYWKDMFHLQHDPKGYISSSLSSTIGDFSDVWRNKDFQGNWVYDPNDPLHKKALDVIKYFFPTPFSLQQGYKSYKQGKPFLGETVEGFIGLTKAPFYIREPEKTKAHEEIERKKQIRKKLRKEARP